MSNPNRALQNSLFSPSAGRFHTFAITKVKASTGLALTAIVAYLRNCANTASSSVVRECQASRTRLVLCPRNSTRARGEDELRARKRKLGSKTSTKPHAAWLNDSELSFESFALSSDNIYNGLGNARPCLCRKAEKKNTSRRLPIGIH